MPSTLSTGYGQHGVLATSPNHYVTINPGFYQMNNVVLTPGIPPFSTEEIYKLSNGPHTPDIAVKFQVMVVLPGAITIDVQAV